MTPFDTAVEMIGGLAWSANPVLESDLNALETILRKWQKAQNLVARDSLDVFWTRHIADSLQLLTLIPDAKLHIVDMGSGGGFPALPLAAALKRSDVRFSLVEANARKCAYLRTVARDLDLPVHVFSARLDSDVSRETGPADFVTARALADLDALFDYAEPFQKPGTRCLFHKGAEHLEEITVARAHWDFDVRVIESKVDSSGVVLDISDLRPKSK